MNAKINPERPSQQAVEKAISFVLRAGVLLSASIICLGLVFLVFKVTFANGAKIDSAIPYPRSLTALYSGLLVFDPASVIALGLLALIATPVIRIVVSIIAFALEGDWHYVAITAVVLTILIVGIVMGKSSSSWS
jgi:uncharacterized membrane protein